LIAWNCTFFVPASSASLLGTGGFPHDSNQRHSPLRIECRITAGYSLSVAWIRTIDEKDASGQLAVIYDAARKRAGHVYNILKVQSQNAAALQAMLDLYVATVRGESPLNRAQREMLAVVVSRANNCHY